MEGEVQTQAIEASALVTGDMQPLFIVILVVIVFGHGLARFRNLAVEHDPQDIHGPANAFTTSLNYWGGAVIYGAIFVLAYIVILLILSNVELTRFLFEVAAQMKLIGSEELQNNLLPEDKNIPIWLAGLLTFAIPTVPILSRWDSNIRARVQHFIGIPEFAWRLADRLETHRDFRFMGDMEGHFNRIANGYLADLETTGEALHDAEQCDALYVRMLYLMLLLDDWAMSDTRYHRFAKEQSVTLKTIWAKLDALRPMALKLNKINDPQMNSILQAGLNDAWLHLRRYIACSAMACEKSAEGIEQRLRLLGFSRGEEVPYSDFLATISLVFVVTFVGTQAVVLLWDIILAPFSGAIENLNYFEASGNAAQIAVLHTIAIALAMWRLSAQMPYPWLQVSPWRDFFLGWMFGAIIACMLPITYPDPQAIVDLSWERLVRAVLLGIPVGAAAYSFVRLITHTGFLASGRMNDSVRQGLYTAAPTAIIVCIALYTKLLEVEQNTIVAVLIATSVTYVIGAVVGAILPVRHRRKRDYYQVTHDQVVTVVGAGIAGLSCARYLYDHGFQVEVLESSQVAGGRIRSAVYDRQEFDLGAQVFQVAPREFAEQVEEWLGKGLIQPWKARVVELNKVNGNLVSEEVGQDEVRYTGISRMDSLISRGLLRRFKINYRTPVTGLTYDGDHGWSANCDNECVSRASHYMVLAVPAPAVEQILAGDEQLESVRAHAAGVVKNPAWVCAVSFETDLALTEKSIGEYQIGYYRQVSEVLNRAYCISHKPGREGDSQRWILVANHQWSAEHMQDMESDVVNEMMRAFWACSGYGEQKITVVPPRGYLWESASTYSAVTTSHPSGTRQENPVNSNPYYFDADRGIGLCGDWCASFGVGHAWASGRALAIKIVEDAGIF